MNPDRHGLSPETVIIEFAKPSSTGRNAGTFHRHGLASLLERMETRERWVMQPEYISLEKAVNLVYQRVKSLKKPFEIESRFIDLIRKRINYAGENKKIRINLNGDLEYSSLVSHLKNSNYSKKHYPGRFDDLVAIGKCIFVDPIIINLDGASIIINNDEAYPPLPKTEKEFHDYTDGLLRQIGDAKREIKERDALIANLQAELEPLRLEDERRKAIAEVRRQNGRNNKPK